MWKFIVNREIEAPARFHAIQTYRAVMAILRQQQHFAGQLYSSGMVDEAEHEHILMPIQRQERMLQRRGPHWQAPSISEVGQYPTWTMIFSICSTSLGSCLSVLYVLSGI